LLTHFRKDEKRDLLVLTCEGKKVCVQRKASADFPQTNNIHTTCSGPFKVRGSEQLADQWLTFRKEAFTGTYEMREDSLFAVNRMIEYFHSGDYDVAVTAKVKQQSMSAPQIYA
jgi:hypothetical protein